MYQPQTRPVYEDAKKRQLTQMKTSETDAKRLTRIPWPQQVKFPGDISKYVFHNA